MNHAAALRVWDRTLTRLWRQSRYASYFYQSVEFVPNPNIPTFALAFSQSRLLLWYNPEFAAGQDTDILIGLLIHEMLHVALNHRHRVWPGQDPLIVNLAQDMVVNTYLTENSRTFFSRKGFQETPCLVLPDGLPRIPEAFGKKPGRAFLSDVTWEEVYAWLMRRKNNKTGEGADLSGVSLPGADAALLGSGEGIMFKSSGGLPLPAGIHLFEESGAPLLCEASAKRALYFAQKDGSCADERLSAELAGLFRQPAPATATWKQRIRTILDRSMRTSHWESTYSRINRRWLDSGVYAPGRRLCHKPLLTVAVDVSGSMAAHPGEMEAAFGLVEDLVSLYEISLLCVDQDLFVPQRQGDVFLPSKGRQPYFYQKGDWRFLRTGSRGATFFAPLFNAYMQGHAEALIVMTDGCIYDLESLRPYTPTVWAIPSTCLAAFHPAFGTVVAMEQLP